MDVTMAASRSRSREISVAAGKPFLRGIMGGDSLLAFFEYPKGIARVDHDAIGAMQHVSFACGPRRYHEILKRLKANGVTINAGPLLVIPPAIQLAGAEAQFGSYRSPGSAWSGRAVSRRGCPGFKCHQMRRV